MKTKEQYVKDILSAYSQHDEDKALNIKSELQLIDDPRFSYNVIVESLGLNMKFSENGTYKNIESMKWVHRLFVDHLVESWKRMELVDMVDSQNNMI